MPLQYYIYLAGIGLSVVLAALLIRECHKATARLPEIWQKSRSVKHFRLSIWFLMSYLLLNLLSEAIAIYLALQYSYNGFVYTIGHTFYFLFFLLFLVVYTRKKWKKYSYLVIYIVLIGYFSFGGYYHPRCILSAESSLFTNGIFFISCLLHLTDLLMNPKADHFRFLLKINLTFLIFTLLATIATTAYWTSATENDISSELVFQLQFFNSVAFYYFISFVLLVEMIKLRGQREAKNA